MSRRLLFALVVGTALAGGALGAGVACSPSNVGSPAGLAQLEADTGVQWVAVSNNRFGSVSYLAPSSNPPIVLTPGVDPSAAAMAFLVKYGAIFGMTDPARELSAEASGGAEGLRFASFTQVEGAASVYGTRLSVVFDGAGRIGFVSGLYVPNIFGLSTAAAISPSQGVEKARADMATRYRASQLLSLEETPAPDLTIYALGGSPVLAYSFLVSYASDAAVDTRARQRAVMSYIVDATSGAILEAIDGLRHQLPPGTPLTSVTVTGQGERPLEPRKEFRAVQSVETDGSAPTYYMQARPGPGVAPRYARQAEDHGPFVVTTRDPSNWDTSWNGHPSPPGPLPNPGSAVDAYYYLGQVDAWWQSRGRNGYDGYGAQLGILVHDQNPDMVNGAAWDNMGGCIDVGVADPSLPPFSGYAPSIDLEVMAHEFQHAVTRYTLNLNYAGQSGALSESISDIFAQFVAHDTPGASANCIIGETWDPRNPDGKPGLRNLVDPHSSGLGPQPDYVGGAYYAPETPATEESDWGGVHTNLGVSNKAWSLATFGGKDESPPYLGVPSSLALGWAASERLYLALLGNRALGPAAQFADIAFALVGAATDIYGHGSSNEAAVACAWRAVGVLHDEELRVTLGVDPCKCGESNAGNCDAGLPGTRPAQPPTICVMSSDAAPVECVTYQNTIPGIARLACPPFMAEVPSCPNPVDLVGCCSLQATPDQSDTCYYTFGPGDYSFYQFMCTGLESGDWTWNPAGSGPTDDPGRDAGPDGGPDAAPAPHC